MESRTKKEIVAAHLEEAHVPRVRYDPSKYLRLE